MTTETTTAPVNDATAQWVADGVKMLNSQIEQLNELASAAERVANSTKVVAEIRDDENTEDETIKKYQAVQEKLNRQMIANQEKVEEYIRNNILQDENAEPFDEDKNAEAYKTLATMVKSTVTLLSNLNGGNVPDGVTEIKSLPGTRKSSATGTGSPKPRFKSVQYRVAGTDTWKMAEMDVKNPKTGEIKKASTLTALAFAINKAEGTSLKASDFTEGLFAEAGTKDLKSLGEKEIVFVQKVKDTNYEIQAITQGE